MSLIDALLLDPFAMDVWIAPRTDGVLGSGTEDDPYDGSVRGTTQIPISSITASGLTATATTTQAHGFQAGQLIQISGITGVDASIYNGTFRVSNVTPPYGFQYALRTTPQGSASSGTCQLDPYFFDDVMRSLPIAITQLIQQPSPPGDPQTAVANALAHGFSTGDTVIIRGATGAYASYYNGTFVVTWSQTNQFTYRMTAVPGGNPDPSGKPYCQLAQFAAEARNVKAVPPLAVRLGPGQFQTKGYTPNAPTSWVPHTGMKITGAGMEVSVLQLAGAVIPDTNLYTAIGASSDNTLDGFEAADFTIDGNISGQTVAAVACGAVVVAGTYSHLRRIRAINWGTQTGPHVECFVLFLFANYYLPNTAQIAGGVACTIEDCVAEQPGTNNSPETSIIGIGNYEVGDLMPYHRGCAVRHNYINAELRQNQVQILSITVSAGVATVTTGLPHGRSNGQWVTISGAMYGGTIYNAFNGSYQISNVTTYTLKYTLSTSVPDGSTPSGNIWVGKCVGRALKITHVAVTGSASPWTITVTTVDQHYLLPGQTVVLTGLTGDQYTPPLNSAFTVATVIDPFNFTFSYAGANKPGPDTDQTGGPAYIGVNFQAAGADCGTAAVVERNRVVNCSLATYHDTFNTKDLTIRNNYFSSVSMGNYHDLTFGGTSQTTSAIPIGLTNVGTGGANIAKATTPYPHGLVSGDQVFVTGADPAVNNGAYYNSPTANNPFAAWTITVVDSTTFTYDMHQYQGSIYPTGPASGAGYFTGPFVANQLLGPGAYQRILGSTTPSPITYQLINGLFIATATVDLTRYPSGHGITPGEVVYISKANFDGVRRYEGFFYVASVMASSFQVILPASPVLGQNSGSSASGYFGRLWTGGKIVNENNIVEILPSQSVYYAGCGAQLAWDDGSHSQFAGLIDLFPQVVLRRDLVRHVDGMADSPGYTSFGLFLFYPGAGIVEENVVDGGASPPVQFGRGVQPEFFDNQSSDGGPLLGYQYGTNNSVPELSTSINDAAILGF